MLIHRLKASGLLSFGPDGVDLPLGNLNVLIGPNGSGKSNLLEVLALLKAAPSSLLRPVRETGGVKEWLWKSHTSASAATLEAIVDYPQGKGNLRHALTVTENAGRLEVIGESIEDELAAADQHEPRFYYRMRDGQPVLNVQHEGKRELRRDQVKPDRSILSQLRDPERYAELNWLQEKYAQISLYRNWSFGPAAAWRREQSAHARGDVLSDGGENLTLVLANFRGQAKLELLAALERLYEGIEDIDQSIQGGNVLLYLLEKGRSRNSCNPVVRWHIALPLFTHHSATSTAPGVGRDRGARARPASGCHSDRGKIVGECLKAYSARGNDALTHARRCFIR